MWQKMITEHIIKDLEKELKDRDNRITLLEMKNHELKSIYNDWLCAGLTKEKKKFPIEYIKQKKEFAKTITHYYNEIRKTSETLSLQDKRHKEEVSRLKFEIELLTEKIPKKSFLDIFKKKSHKSALKRGKG